MNWFPERMTMGLSAQAIAYGGHNHPWDPSDLLRCINYCESSGISTARLQARMSGRSLEWDRLLPEWDNLVELLRDEMENGDGSTAPKTYREMKRVLAGGIACTSCSSTGRGSECAKCKGTGKRGGGRCRAERCFHGADFCPACKGRGHVMKELVTA